MLGFRSGLSLSTMDQDVVSFDLLRSVLIYYHIYTHSIKRKSNNIRCSVATTNANKLIAKTLVDRSLASGVLSMNIKRDDEAKFTHVHVHIVVSPWHQREAEAPCKNATHILA